MTETNTKETKIVKATPKKQDTKDNEPRVTVKAAVIPQRSAAQTKVLQQAAAQAKPQTAGKRQFIGTPVVNKDLENRTSRIPRGMTPVSKDVTDKAIEEKVQAEVKAEVKAAEVKAAEVKAEEPKAEEPKAEKKTAEKKPAEKKTAAKKAEKAAEPAKEEAVEVKAEAPKAEEPKAEE